MNFSNWDTASTAPTLNFDACQPKPSSSRSYGTMESNIESPPPPVEHLESNIESPSPPVEHHPIEGRTFIIRPRNQPDKILTLRSGILEVVQVPAIHAGWTWYCTKEFGWYGFRNTVSGTYIGKKDFRDFRDIVATSPRQSPNEYLMVDRHISGGYVMMMQASYLGSDDNVYQTNNRLILKEIVVGVDGKLTLNVDQRTTPGTLWEFVEAKEEDHGLHLANMASNAKRTIRWYLLMWVLGAIVLLPALIIIWSKASHQ